jgi:hypothetical protein
MRLRNIFLIAGGTMVLGAAAFIIVNRRKKLRMIGEIEDILNGKKQDPNAENYILPQSVYEKLPEGSFPLKITSPAIQSKKVYRLQMALNKNYGTKIDVDGKFGLQTYDTLCDVYWDMPCYQWLGQYGKEIDGSDYNEILAHKYG